FALTPIGAAAGGGALAEPLLAGLPVQAVLATGALLTIAAGAIGMVAATELRTMIAYLILVSVGTLLTGVAVGTAEGIAAGLYYLVHTTLIAAGLFLLTDVIGRGRAQGAWLRPAPQPPAAAWLGALFLLGALAIAGLPPLSGFVGKVLILEAVRSAGQDAPGVRLGWILSWTAVLGSTLLVVVGLSRAGVMLFWRGAPVSTAGGSDTQAGAGTQTSTQAGTQAGTQVGAQAGAQTAGAHAPAAAVLLAASPLLALLAGPMTGYTEAAAAQLLDGGDYLTAIKGLEPVDPPTAATSGNGGNDEISGHGEHSRSGEHSGIKGNGEISRSGEHSGIKGNGGSSEINGNAGNSGGRP
ncbi:MAG: proton-conducting transporter membrane subunit, partial [Halochromatium sp.]